MECFWAYTWLLTNHPLVFLVRPPQEHLFHQVLQPSLFVLLTAPQLRFFSDYPRNRSHASHCFFFFFKRYYTLYTHAALSAPAFILSGETIQSPAGGCVCACPWVYLHLVSTHTEDNPVIHSPARSSASFWAPPSSQCTVNMVFWCSVQPGRPLRASPDLI